tara:strand:+ start:696 stop:1118 length:423 start_codon:yes stop_codon:yes gene_type:complete
MVVKNAKKIEKNPAKRRRGERKKTRRLCDVDVFFVVGIIIAKVLYSAYFLKKESSSRCVPSGSLLDNFPELFIRFPRRLIHPFLLLYQPPIFATASSVIDTLETPTTKNTSLFYIRHTEILLKKKKKKRKKRGKKQKLRP